MSRRWLFGLWLIYLVEECPQEYACSSSPSLFCISFLSLPSEPLPGLDINLFGFASDYLYPFYARLIQAVTGERDGKPSCDCNITTRPRLSVSCAPGVTSPVSSTCSYPDLGIHTDKLMVFEPTAVRNQLDVSVQVSKPFTRYANVAYAPHTYTDSFTLWKKEPFGIAMETAAREASAMRAALLVTEWGGPSVDRLSSISKEQEKHLASAMHWVWKQNGGGGWSLHSAVNSSNFTMEVDRLRAVSRIRPKAVAGELTSFAHETSRFWMSGSCVVAEGSGGTSEIFVPAHWAECGDSIKANGSAAVTAVHTGDDGSRMISLQCLGSGGAFSASCELQ